MRKAIVVAALLAAVALPAWGQVLLQRTVCGVPGNTSKVVCALTKPLTKGSNIRVVEIDRSSAGNRSVAGLTQVSTSTAAAGTITAWLAPSAMATSFTVALPNTYNPFVVVQEDTYGATLDANVSASGAINTTPQAISAGTLTTTAAGDYLLVGCADNYGAGGLTAGVGYNAFVTSGSVPGGIEDRVAGAAGAYAANGTLAKAQYEWACLGMAFRGGTAPPPPPPPQTCTAQGSVTVSGTTPPPLQVTTPFTLPQATVNVAYSANVATFINPTGGVPPYTYAVTAGALPTNLSMSSAGLVTGTPNATGTSNFTVTVMDSSGTALVIEMRMVAGQ